MKLGEMWSTAIRPDAQSFDEIRIKTIPRYKQSGFSGNEWRISANVELLRKGVVVKERAYSDIESAAKFLSWFMVETIENGGGNFGGIEKICDQEGCAEKATIFYQKKKDGCGRCGESKEITYGKMLRKFCDRHKTRGDTSIDDNDDNYTILMGDPRGVSV